MLQCAMPGDNVPGLFRGRFREKSGSRLSEAVMDSATGDGDRRYDSAARAPVHKVL